MKKRKLLFGVFLLIYLVFLGNHALSHLSWFMLIGFFVAVFAHARVNILTLVLLATHMSIEWYTFGQTYPEIPLILLAHVVLDFIFLHHEVKVHIKKHVWFILGLVTILLLGIFFLGYESAPEILARPMHPMYEMHHHAHNAHGPECDHGHEAGPLHDITLGGVIGCVLSHSFFHFKVEK